MGPWVRSDRRNRQHARFSRKAILATVAFVASIAIVVGISSRKDAVSTSSIHISETAPFKVFRDIPSPVTYATAESANKERLVYPYSVVPGGVRDVKELQHVAKYDRVVAQHYAGFNYDRARVIEVPKAKLVYVSYRKNDKIFWTKKKIALHKGEKLITDGNITARTRCANRISETPQKQGEIDQPMAEEFEQPLASGSSATRIPQPVKFVSSLMARPGVSPTIEGGTFAAPPAQALLGSQTGGGMLGSTGPVAALVTCQASGKGSGKRDDCPSNPPPSDPPNDPTHPTDPPPTSVPEPSSILMGASGLVAIYWKYRKNVVIK